MKFIKKIAVLLLALSVSTSALFAEDIWMTDFEAAKAKAKAEDKPLLLDFTGSDWCGWCMRLDAEVFDKEEFKTYAEENLVLVKLDFPKKTELDEETKAQNEKLAKEYGVRGFPTIILLDAEGEKIGKTGYQKGGAEAYVDHLKKMIES